MDAYETAARDYRRQITYQYPYPDSRLLPTPSVTYVGDESRYPQMPSRPSGEGGGRGSYMYMAGGGRSDEEGSADEGEFNTSGRGRGMGRRGSEPWTGEWVGSGTLEIFTDI